MQTAVRFTRALILLHPKGNVDEEQIEAKLAGLGADDCGLRDSNQLKKHVGEVYAKYLTMSDQKRAEILEALKDDGGLEKVKREIYLIKGMNQLTFHPRNSCLSN